MCMALYMQATEETFKLRLELVNQAEKMRQLAAENEALQAAAIDRVRVEQLDAKNKVLLQVGQGTAVWCSAAAPSYVSDKEADKTLITKLINLLLPFMP